MDFLYTLYHAPRRGQLPDHMGHGSIFYQAFQWSMPCGGASRSNHAHPACAARRQERACDRPVSRETAAPNPPFSQRCCWRFLFSCLRASLYFDSSPKAWSTTLRPRRMPWAWARIDDDDASATDDRCAITSDRPSRSRSISDGCRRQCVCDVLTSPVAIASWRPSLERIGATDKLESTQSKSALIPNP